EALFSAAEAKLLDRHAGLRRDRDILLFDPVHCYGLPGYLDIVAALESRGWPRRAFWPHGGDLFCLPVSTRAGPGGAEGKSLSFQAAGGYGADTTIVAGAGEPPVVPGIGFELKRSLRHAFEALLDGDPSVRR